LRALMPPRLCICWRHQSLGTRSPGAARHVSRLRGRRCPGGAGRCTTSIRLRFRSTRSEGRHFAPWRHRSRCARTRSNTCGSPPAPSRSPPA